MKAVVIEEFGGIEKIHLKEMPKPVPGANEVLIQVAYAGVNPVDQKIREGHLKGRLPHEFPLIMGWDASGIVTEVGKNVTTFKVGDEVFAYVRKPLVQWGAYAEYVVFDAKDVAHKPRNISLAQAAALPLVSLTAWQSLFDVAHLDQKETILIHGGSGGVGAMAIQFAWDAGANIITTASRKKHEYVIDLGADLAIDYREDFVPQVKSLVQEGVDVVFDTVGGETFQKSLSCLKRGGRIVSLLEHLEPEKAQKLGITASYHFVTPSGKQLATIAKLIEEKKAQPLPLVEMPLERAAQAQEDLHAGKIFGKIVLKVR